MARVWYVGTYPYREITPQDWDKLGLFGPHYQWSADNGWSVDESLFRPELLAALKNDPEFQLGKTGVRPDTPLPPDDVTRPWKADAEILALVDDAFEALNLAEDALEDIQTSVTAANTAATTAGNHRNAAQGFRNEAEGFKTAAGTSASSASSSAATATTKAGEASVSAAAAKTSETNSKSSETKAKTSETNAKASETKAKTSETNAKTSEDNAGGHAATASSRASEAAGYAATLIRRVNRGGREIDYLPDGRPYLLPPEEVEEVPFEIDTTVGTRVFLGDVMIHGDTGWRNVTSTLESNGANGVAGRLRIRRTAGLVWVSADDLQVTSGTVVLIPDPQFAMDADNSTYPGALYNLAGDRMQRLDTALLRFNVTGSGCRLRDLRSYPCTRPWPTSLPGTPA